MSEEFKLEEKIENLVKLKQAIDGVLQSIDAKTSKSSLFNEKGAEGLKAKHDARIAVELEELNDLIALIDIHIINNAGVRAELIANESQELNAAIRALTDEAFRTSIKQRTGIEVKNKTTEVVEELDKLDEGALKHKTVKERYDETVGKEAELAAEIKTIEKYELLRKTYKKEEIISSVADTKSALENAKETFEAAKNAKGIKIDKKKIEELVVSLKNVPVLTQKTKSKNKTEDYNKYCKNLKSVLESLEKVAAINPEVKAIVEKIKSEGIESATGKITLKDRKSLKEALEQLKGLDYEKIINEYEQTGKQKAYESVKGILTSSPIMLLQDENTVKQALEALKKAAESGEPIPAEVEKLVEEATKDGVVEKIEGLEKGIGTKGEKYKELAELRELKEKLLKYKGREQETIDTKSITIAGIEINDVTIGKKESATVVDFADYISPDFDETKKSKILKKVMKNPEIEKSVEEKYQKQFGTNFVFASIRNFFHKLFNNGVSYDEAKKKVILDGMIKDATKDRLAEQKAEQSRNPWELDKDTKDRIQGAQARAGKEAMKDARIAIVENGAKAKDAQALAQKEIDGMEL